jgi:transcriptional regulator with XRE-family HTH domain
MSTTTDRSPEVRTTSREEIAANVRAEMGRRQVDQAALAAVLGKSNAAVSDRVNGKTHFRVDELQRVAGLLQVPLERLLEPAPEQATT